MIFPSFCVVTLSSCTNFTVKIFSFVIFYSNNYTSISIDFARFVPTASLDVNKREQRENTQMARNWIHFDASKQSAVYICLEPVVVVYRQQQNIKLCFFAAIFFRKTSFFIWMLFWCVFFLSLYFRVHFNAFLTIFLMPFVCIFTISVCRSTAVAFVVRIFYHWECSRFQRYWTTEAL